MPHQCTKCGKIYPNASSELLKGCSCGGRFFFFIKKEKLQENKEIINLSREEKVQIENDVKDLIGKQVEDEQPIILDIEAIKISKPGTYELDLIKLMGDKPLVYKVGEGKYMIDLAESFSKVKKK